MSTSQQDSYAGILAAFNELRIRNEALPREYTANYAGIRDAILDLKKEWGNIDTGTYPSGWLPELDSEGNQIGGEWLYFPEQGDLWFDERQGRLMVWINGDFHQANGADQLTVVSDNQPINEIEGSLWYQPSTNTLYLYTSTGWAIVASGAVDTSQLTLSTDTATNLAGVPAEFPSTNGVNTQKELNGWSIDTFEFLNTKIDQALAEDDVTITVSETQPSITGDGELWYNSNTLQLYVSTGGVWETSTPDFSQASEFTTLQSDLSTLSSTTSTQITGLDTRVATLESHSDVTYTLATPSALRLIDSNGVLTDIAITGSGGTSITFGSNAIDVDTSALESDISTLQTDVADRATIASLNSEVATLNATDSSLQSSVDTNTSSIDTLNTTVAGLASSSDLLNYLQLSGGTMTGALDMGGQVINDVATPFLGTDAANRQYVDDFKTFAASTYATITGTTFSSLGITTNDTSVAGIDFSSSVTSSQQALKLASDLSNTVTFGTTDFDNELAWDFNSTEDFCWKHGTNGKQLSVRSSGAYAKNLFITDFIVDVNGDETLVNTIDVKTEVNRSLGALAALKTALNDNTDYAGFRTDLLAALASF